MSQFDPSSPTKFASKLMLSIITSLEVRNGLKPLTIATQGPFLLMVIIPDAGNRLKLLKKANIRRNNQSKVELIFRPESQTLRPRVIWYHKASYQSYILKYFFRISQIRAYI
jgi:hypothetical protein